MFMTVGPSYYIHHLIFSTAPLQPRMTTASPVAPLSVNNSLTVEYSSFLSNFHRVCSDIGMNDPEKEEELASVRKDIQNVFSRRQQMLEERKEAMQREYSLAKEKTCMIIAQLGDIKTPPENDSGKTLKEQCDAAAARVKTLLELQSQRFQELSKLYTDLHLLHRELGTENPVSPITLEGDLSPKQHVSLTAGIATASEEKARRRAHIRTVCASIVKLWQDMAVEPSGTFAEAIQTQGGDPQSAVYCGPPIDGASVKSLDDQLATLEEELQRRQTQLREFAVIIKALWNRLGVSEAERDTFLKSNEGLSLDVLANCEREVQRLQAVKAEKMAELVKDVRVKITQHEEMLATLEGRLAQLRPILALVGQREELIMQKVEFEKATSDPSRLCSKAPRDPGRLLREEKFRKAIKRELPKLNTGLQAAIQEWETSTGQHFLYCGQRYIHLLDDSTSARLQSGQAPPPLVLPPATPAAATPLPQTPASARACVPTLDLSRTVKLGVQPLPVFLRPPHPPPQGKRNHSRLGGAPIDPTPRHLDRHPSVGYHVSLTHSRSPGDAVATPRRPAGVLDTPERVAATPRKHLRTPAAGLSATMRAPSSRTVAARTPRKPLTATTFRAPATQTPDPVPAVSALEHGDQSGSASEGEGEEHMSSSGEESEGKRTRARVDEVAIPGEAEEGATTEVAEAKIDVEHPTPEEPAAQ
ncbi:putative Microtubule-associated protein; MAP65/ASE1-type [Paratrimastix pyriformis]|uniref:Microtubule-associated protein n=1 Tax=Paratrimastix pyriformis TaxID=342808 RepID=A0ABQ8UH79_9EUKA|nr:putative Microtubule-associated protein; MAP65/ASE1-type [Paratrimastix pyriformis]